jgi:hypothetical protein
VPNLTYTPKPDAEGADSFTFVVNDGTSNSQPATISISIVRSVGKTLNCWWGSFNTNDYNPRNSKAYVEDPKTKQMVPNYHYIDPDGTFTPRPPSDEVIYRMDPLSDTLRAVSAWEFHKTRKNDPLRAAGGAGGANRTVTWESKSNDPAFREVWGYFAEPNISRVRFDRRTNKPTYYFGLVGLVDGLYIGSDCGLQWEPEAKDNKGQVIASEGWTLVNRVTTVLGVTNGRWELFGQFRSPGQTTVDRFKQGTLNTIQMGYVINRSNVATISMSNGAKLPIQYCDPQKTVTLQSLRRNVGLTQSVSADELAKNPDGSPKDPSAIQFPSPNAALVYLDGSIIKGLKFGGGQLKTALPLNSSDPAQITTPWEEVGNSDALRPPHKSDDKFIIDFEKIDGTNPLTKPRNAVDGSYLTNFKTEDVTITMGAPKKKHKIERMPKSRKK